MLLTLALAGSTMAPRVFSVADYGAAAGARGDATAAVARAIAAAKKPGSTVLFPAGEYHFYRENGFSRSLALSNSEDVPSRQISILLENRRSLKLSGRGARLVFHDPVIPIALLDCQDIAVEGFEIDWERPMMSQAEVLEADAEGITLGIDPAHYPFAVKDGRLLFTDRHWEREVWGFMEFDPQTRGVAYGTGDAGCLGGGWEKYRAERQDEKRVRLNHRFQRLPKVGNQLVARHGTRDHAGALIHQSKRVRFENVAFRFTSGLGILSQFSEGLTMKDVSVAPAEGSPRLFAGHDDGLHFSNCKGSILVEGCRFEGLMDDPINVHGTSIRIESIDSPRKLTCRLVQGAGLKYGEPGDTVSFLDHGTLLSRGEGLISKITPRSAAVLELEFQRAIPSDLVVGDALENLTWTPSVTVRRSEFGTVRARGLLVTTPKRVLIEDNRFRSSGTAILIAGDANGWFETGAVRDVTIRRNRFENCLTSPYQFCEAVISIYPEIQRAGPKPYHSNIRIEENVFDTFDAPILWAKSAGNLAFRKNRIQTNDRFRPWHRNRDGITLSDCQRVSVAENHLDPAFLGRSIKTVNDGKTQVERWE